MLEVILKSFGEFYENDFVNRTRLCKLKVNFFCVVTNAHLGIGQSEVAELAQADTFQATYHSICLNAAGLEKWDIGASF